MDYLVRLLRPTFSSTVICAQIEAGGGLDPLFSLSWIHPTPDTIKKGEAEVVNNPRNKHDTSNVHLLVRLRRHST